MGEFRREVLPPRAVGGLTVPMAVVLATLMVSLAMAAMALVPRPTARCSGPRARVVPVVAPTALHAIDVELAPMTPEHAARCRAPVHRALPDGTVETTFELCSGGGLAPLAPLAR